MQFRYACVVIFLSLLARVDAQCPAGQYWIQGFASTVPSGVQNSFPISSLSSYGCSLCHDSAYNYPRMTSTIIENCKTSAGQGYVMMGSKENSSSSSFHQAAFIQASNLVMTSDTSGRAVQTYLSNGAYWYWYNGLSIGFSAQSYVYLFWIDVAGDSRWASVGFPPGTTCANRLSWYIDYIYASCSCSSEPCSEACRGGWRSGCVTDLHASTIWRKVLYSCDTSSRCVSCTAGKYSATTGATTVNVCVNCGAGKYSATTGASVCVDCGAGKYSATTGATTASVCVDCGAGKYSTTVGATSSTVCLDCGTGKYSTTAGATAESTCVSCSSGTSPAGSSAATACVCGAGGYKASISVPTGVQVNYAISSVPSLCSVCYNSLYSSVTTTSNIETCKTNAGNGWILMGSKANSAATSFDRAAFIEGSKLITSSSVTVPYNSNGLYWYYHTTKSVGFTSETTINLSPFDMPQVSLSNICNQITCIPNAANQLSDSYRVQFINDNTVNSASMMYHSSHSGNGNWVSLDLLQTRNVRKVEIYHGNGAYVQNIYVRVGNSNQAGVNQICFTAGTESYTYPNTYEFNCDGRYVFIEQFYANYLLMFELDVYVSQGQTPSCSNSLSWNLDGSGGTRSGCVTSLDTNFQKTMYACASDKCQACPAGKYSTTVGATAEATCLNCAAGKYSVTTGATTVSVCVDCGAGKYSATLGASTCLNCGAGKYSTTTGASNAATCLNCGAGKYSTAIGASALATCIDCDAGKYSTTSGASASSQCLNCPAGKTSPAGSSLLTACGCAVGTYLKSTPSIPSGIQQNYAISSIANSGCTTCYDQAYSHGTSSANIQACKDAAGSSGWILMGSKSNSAATSFSLLAAIKGSNFVLSTGCSVAPCQTGAYLSNGVYWYWSQVASARAVGFAPTSNIWLNNPDIYDRPGDPNCDPLRLSWILLADDVTWQYSKAGWRSGCTETYDDTWRKIMYSCTIFSQIETCAACPAGKYSATIGASVCVDCGAGKYLTSTGATAETECVACVAGKYSTTAGASALATCINCGVGKYSTTLGATVASTCLNCGAGKYLITTGAAAESACVLCGANTYSAAVGATHAGVCTACPGNSTAVAGAGALELCYCVSGFAQTANHAACVHCAPGFYDDMTNRYECSRCGGGLFSAAWGATGPETCETCPAGTWSEVGSPTCQICPANSNSEAGSALLTNCKCNAGASGQDGSTCVLCPAGMFKTSTGSAACSDCSAGKYSTTLGATVASACIECGAGKYLTTTGAAAETACVACGAGKYSSTLGAVAESTCVSCLPSTYSATVGATAASACLACPANSGHALTSQTVIGSCLCNEGYTGPNGGTCTACEAGKYKTGAGSAACTDCGANTYSAATGATDASTCLACPANSGHALAAQTAVGSCLCNLGFTGPNGGTCVSCVAGKYKTGAGSAACTDCDANTYSAATGATDASACLECPSSTQSVGGSTAQTSCVCNPGFTGPNGGTCTACEAGKYKTVTGTAACTDCGANTYSTTTGATAAGTCLSCPANSQSPTGSGAATDCVCEAGTRVRV